MTELPPNGPPEEPSWIGQHIGNYRLIRLIGEGGMGLVFEAVHDGVGGKAAVKILRPQISSRADLVARFFNEARAANAIQHPGIVRVFDCGHTDNQTAYLTMEFLEGESLDARLKRVGRLPTVAALRIGRQLASALGASHRKGIVHRDLKPDNVMLVADPDLLGGERVKVLDFGIAKMTENLGATAYATEVNLVMGTPTYMAPEQCRGAKQVTDRADVYSLGTILYQMLAGRTPFVSEGAGEMLMMQVLAPIPPLDGLVAELDPAVVSLVHAMLAKEATARPDMEAAMAELQQLEKTEASRPPSAEAPIQPQSALSQSSGRLAATLAQRSDATPAPRSQGTPAPRSQATPAAVAIGETPPSTGTPPPAVTPPPVSSETSAVGAASSGIQQAPPAGRKYLLFVGAALALITLVFTIRFCVHPAPPNPVTPQTTVVKPVLPVPPLPVPPLPVPPLPVPLPPTESPEDLAPAQSPVTPTAKQIDAHYTVARRAFEAKHYPEAIKESEKCGHDFVIQCSIVRAKAACHTQNRAPVQLVLDALKDSRRADRDKAAQEIKAECQSDSLDYAEKLLAEKSYVTAQTVARGNKEFHHDRAWAIIGRAACALDDEPSLSQALEQLQPTKPSFVALQNFCKTLTSRPPSELHRKKRP